MRGKKIVIVFDDIKENEVANLAVSGFSIPFPNIKEREMTK